MAFAIQTPQFVRALISLHVLSFIGDCSAVMCYSIALCTVLLPVTDHRTRIPLSRHLGEKTDETIVSDPDYADWLH